MTWGNPSALYGLLAVATFSAYAIFAVRKQAKRLTQLATPDLQSRLWGKYPWKRKSWVLFLNLLALSLLTLALARPQWGTAWEEVQRKGLDIMMVMDTSNSMLAEDLKPSRFQRAKWGIQDLCKKLRGDRIGLLAFAGDSFLQCPLTLDYSSFLMLMEDLYPGIIPRGGTNIRRALNKAMASFKKDSKGERVIILITDGEDHQGDVGLVAEELKEQNICLFVIGVGSPDGELIPVRAEGRRSHYLKDNEGRVVKTRLNEAALQNLVLAANGSYVRASSSDFGLEQIYEKGIKPLQQVEHEDKLMKRQIERYTIFALLAFVALLAASLIKRK